ncbi:MAG TPA: BON domain-containing protein [Leptolyngbyaceae cyanobacterium]
MKKLTTFILGAALLFGTAACQDSKTSTDAPNGVSTQENAAPVSNNQATQAPSAESVQETQKDAKGEVRRDQLNSDIRAREQRNNITGGDANRAEGDLASEVRSKLEANIPKGQLTVDAEDGAVTVAGTVPSQQDLAKIDTLAKEIKGVKSVSVKAIVAPAKPEAENNKR